MSQSNPKGTRRSSAGLPRAQKVKTGLRFRALKRGEVSKQSESDAAPLDSPGAQDVRTVLCVRATRGGEVSKQSEWDAAPLDTPGAQKVRRQEVAGGGGGRGGSGERRRRRRRKQCSILQNEYPTGGWGIKSCNGGGRSVYEKLGPAMAAVAIYVKTKGLATAATAKASFHAYILTSAIAGRYHSRWF